MRWTIFFLLLLCLLPILAFAVECNSTTTYDIFFRVYARRIFQKELDWRWFKAQAIVESGLAHWAVSPKGATGLMQLMPDTSARISRRLGIKDMPFHPRLNIRMGITYDRELWKRKEFGRYTGRDRVRIMLAAYHTGPENIVKAMELTRSPESWSAVAKRLIWITGDDAADTISYVMRVEKEAGRLGVMTDGSI